MLHHMVAALPRPPDAPRRLPLRVLVALAVVYVVWSSTYLAIGLVVRAMPPLLSAGSRFAVAGVALLLLDRARGRPFPRARDWLRALPIGLLLFAGGNGLVALAERTASSGSAALACALAPVWAAVLALAWGERPRAREWIGAAFGVAGVSALSAGAFPDRASTVMLGLAPVCWATGTLLAKRLGGSAALQLLAGGLATMAIGAVLRETIPCPIPARAWLAWGYLTVLGSMVAFTAYAYLVRHAPTPIAMSYAYVNPVLAVLLGAIAGKEAIGTSMIASAVLVTVAIVLIVQSPQAPLRSDLLRARRSEEPRGPHEEHHDEHQEDEDVDAARVRRELHELAEHTEEQTSEHRAGDVSDAAEHRRDESARADDDPHRRIDLGLVEAEEHRTHGGEGRTEREGERDDA